jgi:uncharacterized coiled-coil protein SlyX
MVIKKDLIIAVLATFCLTAALFTIVPTRSSPNGYDPWMDLDDDGHIGIHDFYLFARAYGSSGTPINKTALLLELQSRVDVLNASLLNLEAYFETRIDTLNATIAEQQSRIAELESKITVLNATKLGEPDWDSLDTYGWISILPGDFRVLTHDLHTTNVIVYMVGYDFNGEEFHQIDYGGEKHYGDEWGARWEELTTTTIKVTRFGSDFNWDLIRVMIWKIPEP